MSKVGKYFLNILISIDQLGNTLLGGSPDETVSSRVGRSYKASAVEAVINFLFRWQSPDHCDQAIEPADRAEDAVIK